MRPIEKSGRFDGAMLGMNIYRKRLFELSFFTLTPPYQGRNKNCICLIGGNGPVRKSIAAEALEVPANWSYHHIRQCVPPRYAAFLFKEALNLYILEFRGILHDLRTTKTAESRAGGRRHILLSTDNPLYC